MGFAAPFTPRTTCSTYDLEWTAPVRHDRGVRIDELFSISGKVALVTGGSRGIGEITLADGTVTLSGEAVVAVG